jgi:hypothetical protein
LQSIPRCYLKPFTLDGANVVINLFNIDRSLFIDKAPVKNQCSGDYFYGEDRSWSGHCKRVKGPMRKGSQKSFSLPIVSRTNIAHFFAVWLLQHLRTEAASRRAVEMSGEMDGIVGPSVEVSE